MTRHAMHNALQRPRCHLVALLTCHAATRAQFIHRREMYVAHEAVRAGEVRAPASLGAVILGTR